MAHGNEESHKEECVRVSLTRCDDCAVVRCKHGVCDCYDSFNAVYFGKCTYCLLDGSFDDGYSHDWGKHTEALVNGFGVVQTGYRDGYNERELPDMSNFIECLGEMYAFGYKAGKIARIPRPLPLSEY